MPAGSSSGGPVSACGPPGPGVLRPEHQTVRSVGREGDAGSPPARNGDVRRTRSGARRDRCGSVDQWSGSGVPGDPQHRWCSTNNAGLTAAHRLDCHGSFGSGQTRAQARARRGGPGCSWARAGAGPYVRRPGRYLQVANLDQAAHDGLRRIFARRRPVGAGSHTRYCRACVPRAASGQPRPRGGAPGRGARGARHPGDAPPFA
jgi:hypothetical protein